MATGSRRVALLHYSAPPVIGGVESVMLTHARLFLAARHPVTLIAGKGSLDSLPAGAELIQIPELDSQHAQIVRLSRELEQGRVPAGFEEVSERLTLQLSAILPSVDVLFVHNVFTKHFNLPLTAALFRLLDAGSLRSCVAWCHDLTWTSPNSRSKVHAGYPWELLRAYRPDVRYVTVSRERQDEMAELFGCPPERIRVIYNGVDPAGLLALSDAGLALIERLDLWESDLNLLMPVRVTQAKNIELAIRVLAILREERLHPKLVVTGPPDPHDPKNMEYFQSLLRLRDDLRLAQHVHFVYESGPLPGEPFTVGMEVVAGLFRVSDALFMPSHREGFGMPVLEAGMAGIPVFCSENVPAANEIGGQDVTRFSPEADPRRVASLILKWMDSSPTFNLRRRVRQGFTWRNIFRREILPLVETGTV
jgi:glycosyltransferase involved in cell wall biosynthesis